MTEKLEDVEELENLECIFDDFELDGEADYPEVNRERGSAWSRAVSFFSKLRPKSKCGAPTAPSTPAINDFRDDTFPTLLGLPEENELKNLLDDITDRGLMFDDVYTMLMTREIVPILIVSDAGRTVRTISEIYYSYKNIVVGERNWNGIPRRLTWFGMTPYARRAYLSGNYGELILARKLALHRVGLEATLGKAVNLGSFPAFIAHLDAAGVELQLDMRVSATETHMNFTYHYCGVKFYDGWLAARFSFKEILSQTSFSISAASLLLSKCRVSDERTKILLIIALARDNIDFLDSMSACSSAGLEVLSYSKGALQMLRFKYNNTIYPPSRLHAGFSWNGMASYYQSKYRIDISGLYVRLPTLLD
jgi:hypothetical protein